MKGTTTLAHLIQALIDQEYGDLCSVLDEEYITPSNEELAILYQLLYMVKGATFEYQPEFGWSYEEH